MIEPNFSEAQLQQTANIAIWNHLQGKGILNLPVIPSLPEEFGLGWDTGFYVPWLLNAPLPDNGCNLFIQYKISKQLDRRAKEWADWSQPFMRFSLGYWQKGKWDFHQRDALIALSSRAKTIYVTNHLLTLGDLNGQFNRLLNDLPVLAVSTKLGQHKKVSFINTCPVFKLHSDLEETKKQYLSDALQDLKPSRLSEDIDYVQELIVKFEKRIGLPESVYGSILNRFSSHNHLEGERLLPFRYLLTRNFLKRYFGIEWDRFYWKD